MKSESDGVAAARIEEYAVLLEEATAAVGRHLDELRLALHLLADTGFGALNEHQLEMLDAARAAADAAQSEVARLHEIAELDRRALDVRREPVRIGDVLRSLRPQLEAEGAKTGVTLTIDTLPGLPRIIGDRIRLQQALELLLRHLVRYAMPGAALAISTRTAGSGVIVAVDHAQPLTLDADVALARRIIQAHGGSIDVAADVTMVTFPIASVR